MYIGGNTSSTFMIVTKTFIQVYIHWTEQPQLSWYPAIYCGMYSNGCARCSWQNGSLLTVQISVSWSRQHSSHAC